MECFYSLVLSAWHLFIADVHWILLWQWDQLDTVYEINWNFSNLEVSLWSALFSLHIVLGSKLGLEKRLKMQFVVIAYVINI